MARLIVRPGVLDRIKESRGIQTDEAMALIGGVSLATYLRYRDGKTSPDPRFIASIGVALGYGPGELTEIVRDTTDVQIEGGQAA